MIDEVHLWERPLPSSLQEAAAIHARLCEQGGPVPKAFRLLGQRLVAVFAENQAMQGLWLAGIGGEPLDKPVFSLGIPAESRAQLLPLILREGLALGLAIYDRQAGVCYHPLRGEMNAKGCSPLRLEALQPAPLRAYGSPLHPKRELGALKPTPEVLAWRLQRQTSSDFQSAFEGAPAGAEPVSGEWTQGRLMAQCLPWLKRHGFEDCSRSLDTRFQRLTPAGVQCIEIRQCANLGDAGEWKQTIGLRYTVHLWLPEAFHERLQGRPWVGLGAIRHAALDADRTYQEAETQAQVKSRKHLDALLQQAQEGWASEVLPMLDRCRTYEGLLDLLRNETANKAWLMATGGLLALAHWEGADDFLDLSLKLRQRARANASNEHYLVWDACALRAAPELFGTLHRGQR